MPQPAVAPEGVADPLAEQVAKLDLSGDGAEGDEGPTSDGNSGGSGGAATSIDLAGKALPPSGAPQALYPSSSSGPRGRSDLEPRKTAGSLGEGQGNGDGGGDDEDEGEEEEEDEGEQGGGKRANNNASSFGAAPPPPRPPAPAPPPPPPLDDGQPQACSFFLKTATCAFGSKCRFAHPVDQAPPVRFNVLGLPLRPAEPPCA